MYLDAFTISALVDEFMDTLVGGRVQDTIDTDPLGIGLEIYAHRQRRYLYMSADKQQPRVHVVDGKLRRGVQKPTQVGLLMRRYIEGSTLIHVYQPPYERILHFEFEHPAEGETTIIIEPMERRSNILLVREGVILDCMRRVGPEDNRYRVSLPNHEYEPPPPLTGRADPATMSRDDLHDIFEAFDDKKQKVARVLASRILGISPLMAKEIVYRATGAINLKIRDAEPDSLFEPLQTLIAPLAKRDWQPGVAESDGFVEAYSVFPLTYLSGWQEVESVSQAMSAYYGAAIGEDAYNQAKKPVQAAIDEGKIKFRAKIESMEKGLRDHSEIDRLQQSGELILAYQYNLEPDQTELHAQYEVEGPELVIKLDPDLTPLENAQKYFDRYNRAKRAAAGVPALIAEAKTELRYLEQLENDLAMASSWPEIDDVTQALEARDLLTNRTKIRRLGGGGNSGPMRLTTDGYVIWVGRNSRQNDIVISKHAKSQDLWLHARDVPGSHVVIRDDGRQIPESLIEKAAAIAAYYSRRQGENAVIVDVTHCKYVRKIKGAGPGMVTYRNERTVTVEPQSEEILKNGT